MLQRNWLELSRKLVDKYDLDYTLQGMSTILGEYALSFFGEGVLSTTTYPNPFPITLSGSSLGGTVGNGIAYDYHGMFTAIENGPANFTIPTSDNTNPRWDLLVLRYKQTGDTPVPKPSDPITTINLNLHDDYDLLIIPGTASPAPSYPAKNPQDIILSGIQVPALETLGTQCTLDLSIRELGTPDTVKYPKIKQEALIGTVDGSNKVFTVSLVPVDNQSVLIFQDGIDSELSTDYTMVGQTVTFTTAPALGQRPYTWYVVKALSSINPISGKQETPTGTINGINDTFNLVGLPADQDSTLVFIDGVMVEATEWSLIQNIAGDSIKFEPGSIPQLGQSIYVFYLYNPYTVATPPSSVNSFLNLGTGHGVFESLVSGVAQFKSIKAASGINIIETATEIQISAPGVAGGLTQYGSPSAPVVMSGLITPSADQRQIRYLKSNGGNINVSISAGTVVGQELILCGTDLVDTITIDDGSGTSQNGSVLLNNNQAIIYSWNGISWFEISRRN